MLKKVKSISSSIYQKSLIHSDSIFHFFFGLLIVGPAIYTAFTFDPFKTESPKKTDLQRPVYEFVINDDETVLF